MNKLSFIELTTFTRGRPGVSDVTCPICSEIHNPRRRVLRVWYERHFATYNCARCGVSGWARDTEVFALPDCGYHERIRQKAAAHEAIWRAKRRSLALWLWRRSRPLLGTIAEMYLRRARGHTGPLPNTLRFLAPRTPQHLPAVIAPFGIADEFEPGVLSITENSICGVHLTSLLSDGSGKAGTQRDKLMIGRSTGWPICLHAPNDLLGLAIAEGIENALSVAEATGLGAWAAGCATRLPSLALRVPRWVDCVTVVADADKIGINNAEALVRALRQAGRRADLVIFGS